MNNYLIISNDKIVIDSKINDIVKSVDLKEKEIIKMNLLDNSIEDVLEELNTYNFLSDIKIVILYGCSFIEGDSSYDKELSKLEKYLEQKNDNIFIMVADKKSTKKSIDELLKNVEIIENTISSDSIIKNNLDGYKIDNRTTKYLIDICHNNNEKIINELNKIKLYKIDSDDKTITMQDVDKLVVKEYDDNVFDLVNAISNRNKKKALELYNRLSEKEDGTVIVGTIANKIRMIYSVKVMRDKKIKIDDMAEILGVKSAAVSITLNTCDNFSESRLITLLRELSNIDLKSKSGEKNIDLYFKLFLMNI